MRSRSDVQNDIRALESRRTGLVEELLSREYYPAMQALQKECETLGHRENTVQRNLLGTIRWSVCGYCGASFNRVDETVEG